MLRIHQFLLLISEAILDAASRTCFVEEGLGGVLVLVGVHLPFFMMNRPYFLSEPPAWIFLEAGSTSIPGIRTVENSNAWYFSAWKASTFMESYPVLRDPTGASRALFSGPTVSIVTLHNIQCPSSLSVCQPVLSVEPHINFDESGP
jgi:hypothetical protein